MSRMIVGLDEVGLGALAGPLVVVAAGFRGKKPEEIEDVNDSKRLTKVKREMLYPKILGCADFIGFGWANSWEIDKIGVARAWNLACELALMRAPKEDYELIIDGTRRVDSFKGEQRTVIKGDAKIWQVSAASVVAKVLRDNDMEYLDEFYPQYGWCGNVGYGSKDHQSAIVAHGASPLHRQLYLRKLRNRESCLEDEA